jgi:short-subunit dehydrogenase
MDSKTCVIVGVGPGNGTAFARKFASTGYRVALLARNEPFLRELESRIEGAKAYACDVTDADGFMQVLRQIREEFGPVEVLIYNAGAGKFSNLDDTSEQDLERAWQINARGLLLATKQLVTDMRKAGRGSIVVIGATASLKGNADFLPFASAKAAQRSLAQSLARHLGPEKIHVAYVIIDAVVDLERTRAEMPDKPDAFFINSVDIAEAVYYLTQQPESAWSFEIDLRPFGERW